MINKILTLLVLIITQCSAQNQIVELCNDQKDVFEYKAAGTPFSKYDWNVYQDGNIIGSFNSKSIVLKYDTPGVYKNRSTNRKFTV